MKTIYTAVAYVNSCIWPSWFTDYWNLKNSQSSCTNLCEYIKMERAIQHLDSDSTIPRKQGQVV